MGKGRVKVLTQCQVTGYAQRYIWRLYCLRSTQMMAPPLHCMLCEWYSDILQFPLYPETSFQLYRPTTKQEKLKMMLCFLNNKGPLDWSKSATPFLLNLIKNVQRWLEERNIRKQLPSVPDIIEPHQFLKRVFVCNILILKCTCC